MGTHCAGNKGCQASITWCLALPPSLSTEALAMATEAEALAAAAEAEALAVSAEAEALAVSAEAGHEITARATQAHHSLAHCCSQLLSRQIHQRLSWTPEEKTITETALRHANVDTCWLSRAGSQCCSSEIRAVFIFMACTHTYTHTHALHTHTHTYTTLVNLLSF